MPETTANIRRLQVLPSRSADLCFSVPGIIAQQNFDHQNKTGPAYLGQAVHAFSIESKLYSHLGETITDVNDPRHPGNGQPVTSPNRDDNARLKYDSGEIAKVMTTPLGGGGPAPFLFALRNESIAAALDQAIARREGAYFERFKHGAAIQQALTQGFQAVLALTPQLQQEATNRFSAIDQAHQASGAPPVVTKVRTESSVDTDYKMTTKTKVRNTISVNGEFAAPEERLDTQVYEVTFDDQGNRSEKEVQTHKSDRLTGFPYSRNDAGNAWTKEDGRFVNDSQVSETTTAGKQFADSENPTFFHPRLDNSISHKQLQMGLAGDKMQQSIASVGAPHTERIIADEKAAMDAEVRRLQVTFAESYLTSPISGVVTAVFKDVGECVQAGEAVMRVENDAVVFLVGRVQYFGLLRIGQDVLVRASDLFEAGAAEDFRGRIRGIRGHEADDDEYEVLIECDNPLDAQGRRKLPIYYQFDRDTTKVIFP